MMFLDKCAAEWVMNADALRRMGIDPALLNKSVHIDHGWGKIAGLKAANRKMPFIISYQNGKKARKMDLAAFLNVLRQNSLV